MSVEWSERDAKVSDLRPYERNPRKMARDAFARLKSSIAELGYHQRIIATPDLRVIGGHMRIKALTELGIKEVRVLVPSRDLSEDEFRRLLIQDNLSFGGFDFDILAADFEAAELLDWGFPEADLLGKFKTDFDDEKSEETPDVQEQAISRTGDLWILGPHRLLCGDSTVATDVERVLGGVKPNLMVSDPPYGVEYDADWRNKAKRPDGTAYGALAVGKVQNDGRADWREAWALFPGNIAYVWHAANKAHVVAESLAVCGFALRAQIVWAKSQFVIGRGDYHPHHEPCWYAVRNKGDWHGDRKQSTLWQIDKPRKSETGHSTQKPVECMRRPMLNNSSQGQAVYDPFLGSGTSIIAAEQTGRTCLGLEISPNYCDVIVRRWQEFCGGVATLDGDGRTFAEIEAERVA